MRLNRKLIELWTKADEHVLPAVEPRRPEPRPLRCDGCGEFADERARGWRVTRVGDGLEAECPTCSTRRTAG